MALFFDSSWFDARLAAAGLDRANLAVALGISQNDLAEIWKDQRELSAADVRIIAGLLGVGAASVAEHAGISTPVESGVTLRDLAERISRLESRLDEIHALLIEARTRAR